MERSLRLQSWRREPWWLVLTHTGQSFVKVILGPVEGSAISLMFTKDIISLSQRSAQYRVHCLVRFCYCLILNSRSPLSSSTTVRVFQLVFKIPLV